MLARLKTIGGFLDNRKAIWQNPIGYSASRSTTPSLAKWVARESTLYTGGKCQVLGGGGGGGGSSHPFSIFVYMSSPIMNASIHNFSEGPEASWY